MQSCPGMASSASISPHMVDQPGTLEQKPSRTKDEVIREAKRIEESLLHSSKGHFEASRCWGNFHLWIGIPIVILSTIAGASFLGKLDGGNVLAGILSLIVAVLSALLTFLNPNERVSSHLNAGNAYDALMNQVRMFYSIDCWGEDSDASLTEKLKSLSAQKDELNAKSPQIPKFAYERAKKGIEDGQAKFAVDEAPTNTPPAAPATNDLPPPGSTLLTFVAHIAGSLEERRALALQSALGSRYALAVMISKTDSEVTFALPGHVNVNELNLAPDLMSGIDVRPVRPVGETGRY